MRVLFIPIMFIAGLSGCLKNQNDSEAQSLVGPHPTAVHAAVVEFNLTIPSSPKFQSSIVKEVKVATRKFLREDEAKVFVGVHYRVIYTNDAEKFCGLVYSWNKRSKLVLLEEEAPCSLKGTLPSQDDSISVEAVSKKLESTENSYTPTSVEKSTAEKTVEDFFISNTPEAEFSSTQYVKTTGAHGEVEVGFKMTDAGEVLTCTSLFGYEFTTKKVFSIELSDCHP